MLGGIGVDGLDEGADALTLDAESDGHRVASALDKVLRTGEHRVDEREAADRSAGSAANVAVEADDDGGLSVDLSYTRGDYADDSLVPAVAADYDDAVVDYRGVGTYHAVDIGEYLALDALALHVVGAELGGYIEGVFLVLGEQHGNGFL